MTAIQCQDLHCERRNWNNTGSSRVTGVSAAFPSGILHGICGPDGCGKGLFLNLLGLLETPHQGSLQILGHSAQDFPAEDLADFRNETFGFLFAHPYLLPSFTVAENVAMPLFKICGGDAREARVRTLEVLELSGITHFEETLAGRLDTTSQSRAAFARALVHGPRILIAISPPDEAMLLPMARAAAREYDICVIWAGDEENLKNHADRMITMDRGNIVSDSQS